MEFIKKELINKGWSGDKKYYVETKDNKRYLLRVYSFDKHEKCRNNFILHQKLNKLDIPIPVPIETGECEEGVYILQTWIEGRDAREVIQNFSNKQQYKYGIEAGKILKKIHSLSIKNENENWQTFYNKKIDNKIKNYQDCELKFLNGHLFIEHIQKYRFLLKDCTYTFRHGDFHLGNMMIDGNGKLYIIDFDRCDFGDPINEFDRMTWNADASLPFSCGLIDGYFSNNVPEFFWKLMSLYLVVGIITSLPWSVINGKEEIAISMKQAKNILNWYNNFDNIIPNWYNDFKESEKHESSI